MKYYEVKAKCGHVGMNNYIIKTFAICAENGREAASRARWMPRVKHHAKDAILSVKEIDEFEYDEIIEINHNDNYFKCESIQDQNAMCDLDDEIYRNEEKITYKKNKRSKQNKLEIIFIRETRRMMLEYQY